MERQAGLGRSLEDVLEAVPPIEPTDPARRHALFGIAPDDAPVIVPVANGTAGTNGSADSTKQKSTKKSGDTKQSKKSKKKAKTSKK